MAEEIKLYKVSGRFIRMHRKYDFEKLVRAVSEDNAVNKVLDVISSERLKRRKIYVDSVEIMDPEQCEDAYIQSLSEMQ